MSFEIEMETLRVNSSHWEIGPKRKRFLKSLVRRFGDEVIPDFNKLVTNPYYTLQDIATKYGITRERVRQLVKEVYGYKYTHFLLKLRQQKTEDKVYCRRHPIVRDGKRGGSSEAEAFRKLKDLGMDVKGSPTIKYDMVVNGYKVDVKSTRSHRFLGKCKQAYYFYGATASQIEICDFFILHAIDANRWFIVPNIRKGDKISYKSGSAIYIRVNEHSNRSNFGEDAFATPSLHENNWSILKAAN